MFDKSSLSSFLEKGILSKKINDHCQWGICWKDDPKIYEAFDTLKKGQPNIENFKKAIRMVNSKYSLRLSNEEVDNFSEFLNKENSIQEHLTRGDSSVITDIRFASGKTKKNGKNRDCYSFATKFASFWNRKDFQIYDSVNCNLLSICFGKRNNYRDYGIYLEHIKCLIKIIGVNLDDIIYKNIKFDRKILDMYMQDMCKKGIFNL
jgi:hypothetical protein